MSKKRKPIPYKVGTYLYAKRKDHIVKIKILKYNGHDLYKIAIYYWDNHDVIAGISTNASLDSMNRYKFNLSSTKDLLQRL